MDALISFFEGIGNAIVSAFNFVVSLVSDIVYMIQLTGKFLAQIPSYFSWIPAEITTLLIVLFSVVVIYKILGREG